MLEVKNLTIKNIKNEKEIIKDLSFTVNKNDKLAIIGEEGNGKSTLLKCIYNQDLIKDYTIVTGKIIKNNLNIGYLKQFLESSWENQIVEDYFVKKSSNSEIDYEKYAEIYKLNEIFGMLNLDYDKFVKLSKHRNGTISPFYISFLFVRIRSFLFGKRLSVFFSSFLLLFSNTIPADFSVCSEQIYMGNAGSAYFTRFEVILSSTRMTNSMLTRTVSFFHSNFSSV